MEEEDISRGGHLNFLVTMEEEDISRGGHQKLVICYGGGYIQRWAPKTSDLLRRRRIYPEVGTKNFRFAMEEEDISRGGQQKL